MKQIDAINEPYQLAIIDGRNASYRYYCGMSRLHNNKGIATGMYHGFFSLLLTLLLRYPNIEVIVTWEGGELIRKRLLNSYKEHRSNVPDSLEEQCNHLKYLIGLFGVKQLYAPGYEADDVAACLSLSKKRILFVTEDNDWNQLMKPGRAFWRRNNNVITYEEAKKNLGFPPERYALYTVLAGKESNNVKGIHRFPVAFAIELCKRCSSVNQLIKSVQSVHWWQDRYTKWTRLLIEKQYDLDKLHSIVELRNNVVVEDLPCPKKNMKLLKKELTTLQLFKVIEMIKSFRRLRKCT